MTIEDVYNKDLKAYLLSLPKDEFKKKCDELLDSLEAAETTDLPGHRDQVLRFFEELKKERESSKKNSSPSKQSIELEEPDGLYL